MIAPLAIYCEGQRHRRNEEFSQTIYRRKRPVQPSMFLALLITYPLYSAAYFSLLVQTKNFLAVASDHPDEYNLNWGNFKITGDRLNVIILRRTAPHQYEITAVGLIGEIIAKGVRLYRVAVAHCR